MSDLMLKLSKNPTARKLIKSTGLPLPLPQPLKRARGPYEERPLEGLTLVYGGSGLEAAAAAALAPAGATVHVVGGEGLKAAFGPPGEAHGRPVQELSLEGLDEGFRPGALVFDASELASPAELRGLYDFFNPLVRRLPSCGRVVVLGRPVGSGAAAAAAQAGLEGFVRSLAKELGKKGTTVNLLRGAVGLAAGRFEEPLRFLLSQRSAFVTGQVLELSDRVAAPETLAFVRPLELKVALVTGAARGIGAATARRLAAEGARVLCLDRPEDDGPLSTLAREVGGQALALDVTDEAAPARIAEAAEAAGGVDVVIHNAGITRDKTLAKMKPEAWDLVVDVNLAAIARITEALVAGPLKDGGRLVALSSVAGIAGNLGQTNYGASKAALIGWVRALSAELAERGVTVNAVAPGFIETRLTARIPPVIREAGRRLSALGQGGLPEDVAEAITFLSTPGAAGLTGQVLRVCGGAFIGA